MDSIATDDGDAVLWMIVDLVREEQSGRYLYPTPLAEPYLFRRYVKRWIINGIKTRQEVDAVKRKLMEGIAKRPG